MNNPTDEERTMAALAHAGILANGFNLLGLIGASVIWATHRQRSRYVADHALQALVFQGVGLALTLLSVLLWGGCLLLSLLPAFLRPELYRTAPPVTFWFALAAGLFIAAFLLFSVVYGLLGAWAAWRGQPFCYVLAGSLIARRRQDPPAAPPLTTAAPAEERGAASEVKTLPTDSATEL